MKLAFPHSEDSLVAGLVTFGVGTWRAVMDMDIEDAVRTFCIHYINKFNENAELERQNLERKIKG